MSKTMQDIRCLFGYHTKPILCRQRYALNKVFGFVGVCGNCGEEFVIKEVGGMCVKIYTLIEWQKLKAEVLRNYKQRRKND